MPGLEPTPPTGARIDSVPMARKSLKPQLNQIRAWVQEGRTDAWIAHQLEISAAELRDFRRQHDLAPAEEGEAPGIDVDLRDEIEAEIEAAAAEEEALAEVEEDEAEEEEEELAEAVEEDEEAEADGSESEGRPRRRRRRRSRSQREGGGNGSRSGELEGTFDHGDEGYGLWLDPAITDIPAYRDAWADRREVVVKVEEDRITIRPA